MRVIWRKLARRYHLWCASEDMRRRGLGTPAGVWFCERCRSVAFNKALACAHLVGAQQMA